MPAGRPKKEQEQAAGDAPAPPPPSVKVVGMLPFDEAAVEFGLSKKALREKVDAEVFASARIGDDTYVVRNASAVAPTLGERRIAGALERVAGALERVAGTLEPGFVNSIELTKATQQVAATLGGLALAAAGRPAPPTPPTGTYGEQVDAQVDRAIAQIENAEGDWGLFSQFLQPEWKPLPDVIYHHLQVANAVEIEEYDVTLAIPSRAISVLRAVKAKFGSRAQEQREAEYAGGYQENAAAFRYDSLPVTQLTPSAPFTEEQQRVMERRHLFGVLTPSGLHLASA